MNRGGAETASPLIHIPPKAEKINSNKVKIPPKAEKILQTHVKISISTKKTTSFLPKIANRKEKINEICFEIPEATIKTILIIS